MNSLIGSLIVYLITAMRRALKIAADKYVKMMTPTMWSTVFILPAYPPLMSLLHRSLELSAQIRSMLGSMATFTVIKGNVEAECRWGEKNRVSRYIYRLQIQIMKDLLLPLTVW